MSPWSRLVLSCVLLAAAACAGTKTGSMSRIAPHQIAGPASERARAADVDEQDRLDAELLALEKENRNLELELRMALEELGRAYPRPANLESSLSASTRISDVRRELGSLHGASTPDIRIRVARARELLVRADEALREDDALDAAYLAERAAALVRQAQALTDSAEDRP